MKSKLIPATFLLLVPLLVFGQQQPQAEQLWRIDLPDGEYRLTVRGGQLTVVPLQVRTLTVTGQPPPNPTSLTAVSQTAAAAVGDPATARRLAVASTVVVQLAGSGNYSSVAELQTAHSDALASILSTPELVAAWQPWRAKMSSELTRRAQNGEFAATVAGYTAAYSQIRDGLIAASSGAAAFAPGDLLEIVRTVLDVLQGEELNLRTLLEILSVILKMFG